MSLVDFLRNRPAPRANPEPTHRETILAVLGAQEEMVRCGRLASDAREPERKARAERLRALDLDILDGLDENWERLGTAGLIPPAWLDGTPRFTEQALRDEAVLASGLYWRASAARPRSESFEGARALAMAGEEAATVEALWLEARARLLAVAQEVDLHGPAPLWGWHDWSERLVLGTDPAGQPGASVRLNVGYEALEALVAEGRRRGQSPPDSLPFNGRVAFFMNWLDLPPSPLPLRAPRLNRTWRPIYGSTCLYAVLWELAAAEDLRFPLSSLTPGRRFAEQPNPFLPLVEILRRGYGWTRCAISVADARPIFQYRVALLAPKLAALSTEDLIRDGWWEGYATTDRNRLE